MSTLPIIVAGAGLMGRWHAHEAVKAGARLEAVVDPDPLAARRLAARHGSVPTFGTLVEALAACSATVVHVATPTATHVELVGTALGAGRHVLVEKPLATTGEETERLLALAEAAGRLVCPVHQLPFQRGMQRLAQSPELGKLVRATFVIASAGAEGRAPAARREVLLEMVPHVVSVLRALRLSAVSFESESLDTDELELLGRASHTSVDVFLSLRARPTRCQLTLLGTAASAHADLFHGFSVLETGKPSRLTKAAAPFRLAGALLTAAGGNLTRRALGREPAYPGLGALIRAFYAAVAGGPPPVPVDEIRQAAALADRLR